MRLLLFELSTEVILNRFFLIIKIFKTVNFLLNVLSNQAIHMNFAEVSESTLNKLDNFRSKQTNTAIKVKIFNLYSSTKWRH